MVSGARPGCRRALRLQTHALRQLRLSSGPAADFVSLAIHITIGVPTPTLSKYPV